ncbi:hypothetical protein DH2020_025459 [Rehmannia glutinosa]|uniref:Small ribosomal subunit protein uS7 domain-containing protein n=1 Tax=Rehmannia glutinosa TaxID=99300 RepID=A0ABR0VZM7_REHGL
MIEPPRDVMLDAGSKPRSMISDISLEDYITTTGDKHPTYMPHTAGRYQAKRCEKARCSVVERFTNSPYDARVKQWKEAQGAIRIIKHAMEIIHFGAKEDATRRSPELNIKTIAECLADKLINAAKGSSNTYAIKKKDEIERVAKANR